MKYAFLILFLLNSAHAKELLPPLESKMWNYIYISQVRDNAIVRTKGGWPSFSKFRGTKIHSQESNSFVTSQLLISLSSIDQKFILPNFMEASDFANQFLDKYIDDGKKTNEAEGTIAYWPLLTTPEGKLIRSFSVAFPYRNLSPFNVPNDLDASANYFSWVYKNNIHPEYLNAFAKTAGKYLDLGRAVIHPNDKKWKQAESGAFLTWVEDDKINNPNSRIFRGINDVDCVVNLNILTALLTYKNHLGELTAETESGVKASCELMNNVILDNKSDKCAVWYDRSSQFYTAYAKTYLADEKEICLNNSIAAAKLDLLFLAQKPLYFYTEIAEYMIAIKKLWKPLERTPRVNNLLLTLEKKLRNGIKVVGEEAYLPTTESLFVSKIGPIIIDWYSPQHSTAMALEALLLP